MLALFSTEVRQDEALSGQILTARASVAMDGAAAKLDPSLEAPEVARIRAAEGSLAEKGGPLAIAGASGRFEILVRVPPDCAATLDVRILEGHEE